jgi:hypothetical protein
MDNPSYEVWMSIFYVHSTQVPKLDKYNYVSYSTPKLEAVASYE